ncbi:hypothetical protein CerSpe_204420 [Prunus speciosa]
MGDVYIENEISEMPLAAYNDTVWNTSLLFDSLGFYSSMDDIFTRLLTLASYDGFGNDVVAEDLAVKDADRYSDDLLVISAGQHIRSLICQPGISSTEKLQGSSDDNGWLPHTPGMPGVEDGTARFLELLAGIRNGEHTLPSSFVYLLIPGLFSNHCPLYFVGTKKFFSKMGLACHIAKIHSEASIEHNASELKQYIEELYWGSNTVAGLALVQSPYGGTPLASDILREGQIADKETRRIMELLICKLIKGDIRALEDLTYEKRKEFIMKHKLPYEQIPLVSFHSEVSIAPDMFATMTHIAHAELPWLPLPNFLTQEESDEIVQAGGQLPVVIPLSAAMAVTALHLQLRYGEKSDGLVTCRDAQVPGSVVVTLDRKL